MDCILSNLPLRVNEKQSVKQQPSSSHHAQLQQPGDDRPRLRWREDHLPYKLQQKNVPRQYVLGVSNGDPHRRRSRLPNSVVRGTIWLLKLCT